jgi:hypothetical protein
MAGWPVDQAGHRMRAESCWGVALQAATGGKRRSMDAAMTRGKVVWEGSGVVGCESAQFPERFPMTRRTLAMLARPNQY